MRRGRLQRPRRDPCAARHSGLTPAVPPGSCLHAAPLADCSGTVSRSVPLSPGAGLSIRPSDVTRIALQHWAGRGQTPEASAELPPPHIAA